MVTIPSLQNERWDRCYLLVCQAGERHRAPVSVRLPHARTQLMCVAMSLLMCDAHPSNAVEKRYTAEEWQSS